MAQIRLTASQWIEKYRRGAAVIVEGRRHVVARAYGTGESACVEVEVEDPDVRCAIVDGQLDAADMARAITGFRGSTVRIAPTMRYLRSATDQDATIYVFDPDTGMVYMLD